MGTLLQAEVLEVHSGDDMVLLASLGVDNLYKKVRVRLHGVDTPDAYRAAPGTEAGDVRDAVAKTVKGKRCTIDVHTQGKGSWIVSLYLGITDEAECLNTILQKQGYVFTQEQ